MLTELTGQIERITYTNEENGFTIAQVHVRHFRGPITVVGNLMAPRPGEVLDMRGEWTEHPKFGRQFKVHEFRTKVPATLTGIKKYLGSGLIKGLGPVMAERIVSRFGTDTLDILENNVKRLAEVKGVGKRRIRRIARAWNSQREIRDLILFLQSHGVSSAYASKIFKHYGHRSIAIVKENPFRLASEIFGIGFLTADKIAERLGFSKNSSLRVEAGILYVLAQLSEEGHVYYPYELLLNRCREILGVDREAVSQGVAQLVITERIIIEDLDDGFDDAVANNKAVYLSGFYFCETELARRMKRLSRLPKSIRNLDTAKAMQWVQDRLSMQLAEKQRTAVRYALENKVLVITGGPGTGKTTLIHVLIKILAGVKARVLLAAPTGRAAKRLSESAGRPAKTIHRLLEYSLQKGGFQRDEDNPLQGDVVIIDEASMIDTLLMHHLLKALPTGITCILVGDVNQLPSVGAGNVLNDIIASETVPVVELNEIFRQAKSSRIIVNAHKINSGRMPALDADPVFNPRNDFYFIEQDEPDKTLNIILELVQNRIPKRFGFKPLSDIQVLTPMHKGVVGAANLNQRLQQILNPGDSIIERGERSFRNNDRVMQIQNNYDKEVFNGDIGRILSIQSAAQQLIVDFEGREVRYEVSELDELVLAYAISVHKSQGSEYPVVVVPILTQHYILLQRNLIYTAVTRGKKLVVVVGSRKALAMGIHNNKPQQRYTRLDYRLKSV